MKPSYLLERIWPLIILVGVFAFTSTHPLRPHDFWWHMAIGRTILATGQIPALDTYSFTALGQPYPSYQMFWLPEVTLYSLYQLGGAVLVLFVYSLMITAAYGLLLRLCWQIAGNGRTAALAVLWAAALGLNDWNVRPQGITFFLGVLVLWVIYQLRAGGNRWGLLLPPICLALWANCHGSFPIGLVFLGVWLAEEAWATLIQRKPSPMLIRAILALLISSLACLLNPRGLAIFDYVTGMAANPIIQKMIPEWAPPSIATLGGQIFYGGLLLCGLIVLFSSKRPTLGQVITLLGFAALGVRTARGSVWFGLAVAPIVADHLAALLAKLPKGKDRPLSPQFARMLNIFLVSFLLFITVLSLPWFKESLPFPAPKAGLISSETPIAAVDFLLRQKYPGHVFHSMSFGSYLAWAAQPDYPVFVDSRIELYSLAVWQDYIAISNAVPDWQARLERYDIRVLMLSPLEFSDLIRIASAAGWRQVYADPAAVILIK